MKWLITLLLICGIRAGLWCVEELPDVEISGPSLLKSILEKHSLGYEDLRIPDITDSLKPILPLIKDNIKFKPDSPNNYLHLNLSNKLDYQAYFMGDNILKSPFAVLGNIESHSLGDDWTQQVIEAGATYSYSKSQITMLLKEQLVDELYAYDTQYIKAINVIYDIKDISINKYKADIYLNGQLQKTRYEYLDLGDLTDKYVFYNRLGFNTGLSDHAYLSLDAGYLAKNPFAELKYSIKPNYEIETDDLFSSVSLMADTRHIMPGLHISKRFFLNNYNYIHIFQKSALSIHDNYTQLIEHPWQKQFDQGRVSFQPINLHCIYNQNLLFLLPDPLNLNIDLGLSYEVGKPVFYTPVSAQVLPQAVPENIISDSGVLSIAYKTAHSLVSQSINFEQGWLTQRDNQKLAYQPLFSLASTYKYHRELVSAYLEINQFLNTKDENGKNLRESIEFNAGIEVDVFKNFSLDLKLRNALNKAQIFHRNIPSESALVRGGIHYRF